MQEYEVLFPSIVPEKIRNKLKKIDAIKKFEKNIIGLILNTLIGDWTRIIRGLDYAIRGIK